MGKLDCFTKVPMRLHYGCKVAINILHGLGKCWLVFHSYVRSMQIYLWISYLKGYNHKFSYYSWLARFMADMHWLEEESGCYLLSVLVFFVV